MPAVENSSSEVVGQVWLVPEGVLERDYYYGETTLSEELTSGEYIVGFHTIRFMDTDGCGEDIEPYYEEPEEPGDEEPGEDEPGAPIIGPY
jgi:hypothetical protein